MSVPEIKVAPYVPHDDYAVKHEKEFHKPFPPVPSDATVPAHTLPRLQTQNLDHPPTQPSQSLQVPAPAYHVHLTSHNQHGGPALSPLSSAKSTYLSVSPIEPLRERTSLQTFTTPVISRFSQNSYEFEPPKVVTAVRLFIIRWVIEWWLVEIISWIFGTMCIAIVVGVLLMYDGNEIPQWPLGITIGGFLAVFSAFAKAGLLLPTAECLGQLKWNWFKDQPRSMIDFEILDSASRGPWGSFLLLIRTMRDKGLTLASVGGAVIILCVPIDLFFQQVVGTPKVWIPVDLRAVVPRATTFAPPDNVYFTNSTNSVTAPDITVQNVMQPFIFSNGSVPELDMACPTSNCTWEPFETLALCSSCDSRVISELEFGCYNATAEWQSEWLDFASYPTNYPSTTQCGWFLNASSDSRVLMSGYAVDPITGAQGEVLETRLFPMLDANTKQSHWNGSIYFKHLMNPVTDSIIAHTPGGVAAVYANQTPVAYECVITWCAQTLETMSFEGKLIQNAVSNYTNDTTVPPAWNVNLETFIYDYNYNVSMTPPNQHLPPTEDPSTPGQDITFSVSNDTGVAFQFMIDIMFPSFVTKKPDEEETRTKYYTINPTENMARNKPTTGETPWQVMDIPTHMDQLALAMSNTVRNFPDDNNSKDYIKGTAWLLRIHVEVRWAWLILPVALAAISLLFLVTTVAKSSRDIDDVGIWKNSALAILFNGLGDDVQRSVGPNARMGEIRNKAMDLSVKIVPE